MKKKIPRMSRTNGLDLLIEKIKSERIKHKFKKAFTFKKICQAISLCLYVYVGVRLFLLAVKLFPLLIHLFVAILRLPEEAFTNKFVLLIIMYAVVMYFLLKTMFNLAIKCLYGFDK